MYVMYACDVDEADVCESDVDKVDGHDADDVCDVWCRRSWYRSM